MLIQLPRHQRSARDAAGDTGAETPTGSSTFSLGAPNPDLQDEPGRGIVNTCGSGIPPQALTGSPRGVWPPRVDDLAPAVRASLKEIWRRRRYTSRNALTIGTSTGAATMPICDVAARITKRAAGTFSADDHCAKACCHHLTSRITSLEGRGSRGPRYGALTLTLHVSRCCPGIPSPGNTSNCQDLRMRDLDYPCGTDLGLGRLGTFNEFAVRSGRQRGRARRGAVR